MKKKCETRTRRKGNGPEIQWLKYNISQYNGYDYCNIHNSVCVGRFEIHVVENFFEKFNLFSFLVKI